MGDAPTDKARANAVPKGFTPWKKGQSGNPKGMATGSRHKTTIAIEALLDGQAEGLTQKAVEMALAGDTTALKLCLDRIVPPRKDRPVAVPLPKITNAEEASQASAALLAAVGSGELTPGEGAEIGRLIDGYVRAIEVSDFEKRLARLEGRAVTIIPPAAP